MMITIKNLVAVLLFLVILQSCGKGFLDMKPVKVQEVPSTLKDYMAMMDHANFNIFPYYLSLIGGEEFDVVEANWNSFPLGVQYYQKNIYTWADDVYEGAESHDWNAAHSRILACNIVLEGLDKYMGDQNTQHYKQIKGTALFHRASILYNLAQVFAYPYIEGRDNRYGLPFFSTSEITRPTYRRSLKLTYDQIINDMHEALDLLPEIAEIRQQPSKQACYALLARIYLQIGAFEEAYSYADKCLQLDGTLLDYNVLNLAAAFPFPIDGKGNPEIIFYEYTTGGSLLGRAILNVSNDLLACYGEGDLRPSALVQDDNKGRKYYKGSYMGKYGFFTGPSINELYLIRAESAAYLGKLDLALEDVNQLRKHRFDKWKFSAYHVTDKSELLSFIFEERRRELPFRNRRWEDLRRWNAVMDSKKSIRRKVAGKDYTLMAESLKWTWPMTDLTILYGGYEQNPR